MNKTPKKSIRQKNKPLSSNPNLTALADTGVTVSVDFIFFVNIKNSLL